MHEQKPVAIVGLGAIMPDAFDVAAFWNNIKSGQYSITRGTRRTVGRIDLYYSPDPSAPDKTYSKIGGWVTGFQFEPFKWGIAIPPRVLEQMDEAQQWAIAACRQALLDYGYPQRSLDLSRVAVILGNALGGEKHYITTLRIRAPEFAEALAAVPDFQEPAPGSAAGPAGGVDATNIRTDDPGYHRRHHAGRALQYHRRAGGQRVQFHRAELSSPTRPAPRRWRRCRAAVEGLNNVPVRRGADRRGGPHDGRRGFVKFSKIGALSPDGSRPYADGANGFVMGEGAAIFLLKRLEDAERDGDKIYAVIRGIGSSSDGKGKGITAPNPTGQQQALERAWKNAGLSPATVGLIEGHGTSTRVGDVVEVNSLNTIFGQFGLPAGKIALGSVKSNIGHLKSAAGAAGLLKAVLALHEKVLPPSVNFERPNPNIDFCAPAFYVNTRLQALGGETRSEVRRAGVSSFGFGGTNFHVVLEEYIPGVLMAEKPSYPRRRSRAARRQGRIPTAAGCPAVAAGGQTLPRAARS